jgi:hypothetical protein
MLTDGVKNKEKEDTVKVMDSSRVDRGGNGMKNIKLILFINESWMEMQRIVSKKNVGKFPFNCRFTPSDRHAFISFLYRSFF